MNADQLLHNALQERLAKENAFFELLKTEIKKSVDEFKLCDTSSSPEVEERVNLSIAGLNDATRKLKDETVLNKETARGITDWFSQVAKENHLVQDSNHEVIPQWFAPPAPPAPTLVDRAKKWFTPRKPDPAWEEVVKSPNSIYTNPIYQAEPYDKNKFGSFGGKRKTRKYRRKV